MARNVRRRAADGSYETDVVRTLKWIVEVFPSNVDGTAHEIQTCKLSNSTKEDKSVNGTGRGDKCTRGTCATEFLGVKSESSRMSKMLNRLENENATLKANGNEVNGEVLRSIKKLKLKSETGRGAGIDSSIGRTFFRDRARKS